MPSDLKTLITVEDAANGLVFDFELTRAVTDEFSCDTGPVRLIVKQMNGSKVWKPFDFPQICVVQDDRGKPKLNGARLYDYQGTVQTGDFNFDDSLDFAVQSGREGCYGGPSYDVFLFDPESEAFAKSEEFTLLATVYCGFFRLDPQRKELSNMFKSGCCWHNFVTWKVVNNRPVVVEDVIEESDVDKAGKEWFITTTKRLVQGKWKTTTKRTPAPPESEH
jgi:hypothetical protein